MTTDVLRICLVVVLVSCGQGKSTRGQLHESGLKRLEAKFKYRDLKDFIIDSFDFDSRVGHYHELDSVAFSLIFQEGDRVFVGQGYNRDYFYSWQSRDTNFIEFTVLTEDERSSCSLLRYYIFNKSGKFISKFDIATSCGDAGWTFSGVGRQLTRNEFLFRTVDSEDEDGEVPELARHQIDSIDYRITILSNGQISKAVVFERHSLE